MATRIPITKDNYHFDDRQKKVWEDMERDMERRRREWEDEIDRMRKDFFTMRPDPHTADLGRTIDSTGTLSRLPARVSGRVMESDDGKPIIEKDETHQPVFKVRFNMSGYTPEEVSVKMDSSTITVSAKHQEKKQGSRVTREYSRQVQIPRDVDPLSLQCTLGEDGFLVVHAPLPVPSYSQIKDSAAPSIGDNTHSSTSSSSYYSSPGGGPNKVNSSYHTSSSSTTSSSSSPSKLQPHQQQQQRSASPFLQHQQPLQRSSSPYLHQQQQQQQHHQQQQQQQHQQLHPQQHQHQFKSQVINQQEASPSLHQSSNLGNTGSNYSTSSRSHTMHEEAVNHPDHVTPSYKPPPDLSKLDFADSASTTSSAHQLRSSPVPSTLRQTQPSPSTSSTSSSHHQVTTSGAAPEPVSFPAAPNFPSMPPFTGAPLVTPSFPPLNPAFPTGPLFPDSPAAQTGHQLAAPEVTSHDGKFQLRMPIEDFRPEELTVKTQDGKVVILAKREMQDGGRSQSAEMSREHSLPTNVDPLTVKAFFTDTGYLVVEAPFIN